jgi:RNA polymerase sigma factor (sigma-70 family)
MIEKTLIYQCQQGDPNAWQELVTTLDAHALGVARRITRDDLRARDIVQNAWENTFLHIKDLQIPEAFLTWFDRIIVTQAYKQAMQEPQLTIDPALEHPGQPSEDEIITLLDLKAALDHLPIDLYQIILLAGIYDWPLRDVAAFLGIPIGTVKSRAARARWRLRIMLFGQTPEPSDEDLASIMNAMAMHNPLEGNNNAQFKEEVSRWRSIEQLFVQMGGTRRNAQTTLRQWLREKSNEITSLRFITEGHRPEGNPLALSQEVYDRVTCLCWFPNRIRIDCVTTDGKVNYTLISNEKRSVMLDHIKGAISEQKPSPRPQNYFHLVSTFWETLVNLDGLAVLGQENIGEFPCVHVYVPLGNHSGDEIPQNGMHYWIDIEHGLWRRNELRNDQGHYVSSHDTVSIELNPPVRPEDFQIDIPPSATRTHYQGYTLPEAIKVAPFTLMGLEPSFLQQINIDEQVLVRAVNDLSFSVVYGDERNGHAININQRPENSPQQSLEEFERTFASRGVHVLVPELGNDAEFISIENKHLSFSFGILKFTHNSISFHITARFSRDEMVMIARNLKPLAEK